MRKTLLLALLTLSCTTTTGFADDLFFKGRFDDTYDSGTTPASRPTQSQPQRPLAGISGLQTTLLAAGYNARIDESETVSIELSNSDWTATVAMNITDGGRTLQLAMQLTNPDANTVIAPKTLRGMLEANGKNRAASFVVTGDPQRIELHKVMSNNGLDSGELRAALEAMADMAEKTKDIWNVAGVRIRAAETETPAAGSPTTTPAPEANTAPTAAPNTAPTSAPNTAPASTSLNGKWIATPNTNEAFALQLDANGSFRLVHVKASKSTKSKGTYTLAGTSLSLKGDDGTNLTGTITRQTDSFVFTLGTGSKTVTLTFKSGS